MLNYLSFTRIKMYGIVICLFWISMLMLHQILLDNNMNILLIPIIEWMIGNGLNEFVFISTNEYSISITIAKRVANNVMENWLSLYFIYVNKRFATFPKHWPNAQNMTETPPFLHMFVLLTIFVSNSHQCWCHLHGTAIIRVQ